MTEAPTSHNGSRSRFLVWLVMLTFFVISLLTNILGPIIPDIIINFHVSLTAAGFLIFAFFIAYGCMSIPAGFLIERFSEKPVMIGSFVAAILGSISFALFPTYKVAMASLFVIGAGMASLQVAINPLLRVAGGEEHFAFNEVLAQLLFGSASFLSPQIYSYLVLHLRESTPQPNALLRLLERHTPRALPWLSLYWIFAVTSLAMVVVFAISRFPRVEQSAQERPGSLSVYRDLLRRPIVWLFFVAIFAYVGCEQGTANWISEFLSRYHGVDPHTLGARTVSLFWGLMTLGCGVGLLLLKLFDSRRVLAGGAIGALLCLSLGLFGNDRISVAAFPFVGLFASVMWPVLISLALNSIAEFHGSFTGILSTGIMGGAVVPVIIGRLGDRIGLRGGLALLYLNLAFVLGVAFWAKPLVTNQTFTRKRLHTPTPAA